MTAAASPVEHRFAAGSRFAGFLVVALGLLALAGWIADLPLLTSVLPGLVSTKANAAICFVLSGAALVLLNAPPSATARRSVLALAAVLAAVGAITLVQDVFGFSTGLDQLLFFDAPEAIQTGALGRMSPGTAAAFVLAGASAALMTVDSERAARAGQTLAGLVSAIALVAIMGYLLDVQALYRIQAFTAMAFNTAVALFLLALGLLVARSARGWMRELAAQTSSAQLARRLALAIFVLLPALAMLRLQGERFGWYETAFGVGLHAVAGLVLIVVLLWFLARAGNRAEEQVARLHRVQAVLSGVNALIVRTHDRRMLLEEACRIAVDPGGYPLVWIGLADAERTRISPVASAGAAGDFLEKAGERLSLRPETGSPGPAARAVLSGRPHIVSDVATAPDVPFRAELLGRGVRAFAMLPLVVAGEARGVLAVHAADARAFEPDEMRLLEQVGGDIAYALDHIDKEERLNYLAYYNTLTRLANPTLFHDRLSQHIAGTGRARGQLGLLLLDIAGFRHVNAALGRHAGDEVLRAVGGRLERALDASLLARIDADRFAVIVPRLASEEAAVRMYERIAAECFREPFDAGSETTALTVRAGIAVYPRDGVDVRTLFQSAEFALGEAKKRGDSFRMHDPASDTAVRSRLRLEADLRRAIERRELRLYYQPKVDLRTRALRGAEALMRWQSPEWGFVPPAEFIPLMEETRLILEAGAWALAQAASDARAMADAGFPGLRLAVNVSAIQLRAPDFAAAAARAAGGNPGPRAIELEITESVAMHNVEEALAKLEAARALGFSIAIDDFGTGYSSLAHLARIPAQALKIDRSFISALPGDAKSAELVRAIVGLAHSLGMRVVAEGVETEPQARFLADVGCDEMQGYLVSEPLPLDDFIAFASRAARGTPSR
ncbi:MAG TPA: GGDEF domain-containing protein [Candidatus Acidoferrales bacterium]|nr:GGDEF domain-containing protein [Candidatus Acidoferrales bacterium]